MNNFALRREAKLQPEYPLAPNCRRSWWNMTGSTPASENFSAKNATQMCLRAHKAPYPTQYLFNFAGYLHATYLHFRFNLLIPRKKNSGIGKFPVYRGHLNFATCCNCFQVFEFSLVHPVRLVFSEITHEICNGGICSRKLLEMLLWATDPSTSNFTNENTSLEYCFMFWKTKRNCGPKWETMRNNEAQSGPMNSK
jgi:hypothetical protein